MPFWVSPARSSITNSRCYLGPQYYETYDSTVAQCACHSLGRSWSVHCCVMALSLHANHSKTTDPSLSHVWKARGLHHSKHKWQHIPGNGHILQTADRGMGRSPLSRRLTHKSQESGVALNKVAATVMDPQQRLNTLQPVNGATRVWPDRLSRGILVCKHVVRC